MAAEGLIEAVRTEQAGNLPARTVYAITGEGRKELLALRAEAFRQVGLRPDPVDLAVAMSSDLPREELRALVADRHRALTAHLEFFRHEQDRSWAEQTVADSLILACHRPPGGGDPMARGTARRHSQARPARCPGRSPAVTARRAGAVSVRPIRELGDPVLRDRCAPVTRLDAGLARLVTDLLDTCRLPGRAGPARPDGWGCGCSASASTG